MDTDFVGHEAYIYIYIYIGGAYFKTKIYTITNTKVILEINID